MNVRRHVSKRFLVGILASIHLVSCKTVPQKEEASEVKFSFNVSWLDDLGKFFRHGDDATDIAKVNGVWMRDGKELAHDEFIKLGDIDQRGVKVKSDDINPSLFTNPENIPVKKVDNLQVVNILMPSSRYLEAGPAAVAVRKTMAAELGELMRIYFKQNQRSPMFRNMVRHKLLIKRKAWGNAPLDEITVAGKTEIDWGASLMDLGVLDKRQQLNFMNNFFSGMDDVVKNINIAALPAEEQAQVRKIMDYLSDPTTRQGAVLDDAGRSSKTKITDEELNALENNAKNKHLFTSRPPSICGMFKI